MGEDRGSFSNLVRKRLEIEEEKFWRNQLQRKSKLRLYRKIKTELRFEEYLIFLNRVKSRNLTLLRGGSPQLRIETGRWRGESEKERCCNVCISSAVEDEVHFMSHCPMYVCERARMFERIREKCKLRYVEEMNDDE